MSKKLYVGNLPYTVTDRSLTTAFSTCGTVESVKVIFDRETGRSKGFAFIEMSSSSEAQESINRLNGTDMEGRSMNVSEAKPMPARSDSPRSGFNSRLSY